MHFSHSPPLNMIKAIKSISRIMACARPLRRDICGKTFSTRTQRINLLGVRYRSRSSRTSQRTLSDVFWLYPFRVARTFPRRISRKSPFNSVYPYSFCKPLCRRLVNRSNLNITILDRIRLNQNHGVSCYIISHIQRDTERFEGKRITWERAIARA